MHKPIKCTITTVIERTKNQNIDWNNECWHRSTCLYHILSNTMWSCLFFISVFMFKYINNLLPAYLYESFKAAKPTCTRRSSNGNKVDIPTCKCNLVCSEKSFKTIGASIWNDVKLWIAKSWWSQFLSKTSNSTDFIRCNIDCHLPNIVMLFYKYFYVHIYPSFS